MTLFLSYWERESERERDRERERERERERNGKYICFMLRCYRCYLNKSILLMFPRILVDTIYNIWY